MDELKELERLLGLGKLAEAGREASRISRAKNGSNRAPKRGNRRSGGLWRKSADWQPDTIEDFVRGRMAKIEHIAGERAKDDAIRSVRALWLPSLEGWLAHRPDCRAILEPEIKRLKRCLGIGIATPDRRREQTRERVRRFRGRMAAQSKKLK
jgi:hypothetical protein